MIIAYKDKIQNSTAWAKELGIPKGTIESRLDRGWSVDRALAEPCNRVYAANSGVASKSDAERYLDDLPRDKWPKGLAGIISDYKGRVPGAFIRSKYREQFDAWFSSDFSTHD